ncbi:MAG: hypothetical protein FWD73_17790 [Polyangiaceae bacterium]|nr:hypothetical protein [Polyangiaceae bacterium]
MREPRVRFAAEVLLAAVLGFVAFAADSAILTADLHAPTYWLHGDSVALAAMHFKGMFDNGWYIHNAFIGAPFGAFFEDFPAPDLFYLGIIKLLVVTTHDWVVAFNLLAIFGYPVAAASAFAVVRKYGVCLPAALACGVLFALLPFHQYRLYEHITLGFSYTLLPFAVVPAIELLRCSPLVFVEHSTSRHSRWPFKLLLRDRASIGVLFLAAMTGLWGFVYFTYFALAAYVVAGIAATVQGRSILPLLRMAVFAGLASATFVAQNLGVIAYLHANGRPPVSLRDPFQAEFYGLKLFQLVVPTTEHRLEMFRLFRRAYDTTASVVVVIENENKTAYLGFVGATGFFVLLIVLLRGPRSKAAVSHELSGLETESRSTDLLWPLAVLNIGAFVLGTIGGFGSLIAYLGFPDIRAYNRISTFIGFYALFAMAILVDRALARAGSHIVQWAMTFALGVVTVLGVYDQTAEGTPDYDAFARAFRADHEFVRSVENRLPKGASVLQLPYFMFPERGTIVHMPDYTHLMPYVHSDKLRYSYGAMRGRIADQRYHDLASTPIANLANAAAIAGYDAIWVDARGFEDSAKALSARLRQELGEPLAVSPGGVLVWSIVDHTKSLRERLGPDFDNRKRAWYEQPFLACNDGFYRREWSATDNWCYGKAKAKAFLVNPTNHTQRVVLDFWHRSAAWAEQPFLALNDLKDWNATDQLYFGKANAKAFPLNLTNTLEIDGLSIHESLQLDPTFQHFEKTLDLPPGTHAVRFHTINHDGRERVLVIFNPKITLLPSPER